MHIYRPSAALLQAGRRAPSQMRAAVANAMVRGGAVSARSVATAAAPPDDGGCRLVNGRELSRSMRDAIKSAVRSLKEETGHTPHLGIVTVGERPPEEALRRQLFASGDGDASWWDVGKIAGAKAVGMDVTHVKLPGTASLSEVKRELRRLSRRRDIHGVMLELPVPKHLQPHRQELWACIDPRKDVDGMTVHNAGRLLDMAAGFVPPGEEEEDHEDVPGLRLHVPNNLPTTALATMEYLDACGLLIRPGVHCVIVGRSKLVGMPLAALLSSRKATVTIANSRTPKERLAQLCRSADVIIAAAGVPGIIKPEWVTEHSIVVNVGTTFDVKRRELLPDVDRRVGEIARIVTPTPLADPKTCSLGPSGVGPLTLPLLLHSTLINAVCQVRAEQDKEAYKQQHGCRKDTPALSPGQLQEALKGENGLEARGWRLSACLETRVPILTKIWVVKDFEEAIELINEMKELSEEANHHPTIHLTKYRYVQVDLSSAATLQLTQHDLDLADAYDQLHFIPFQPKPGMGP